MHSIPPFAEKREPKGIGMMAVAVPLVISGDTRLGSQGTLDRVIGEEGIRFLGNIG